MKVQKLSSLQVEVKRLKKLAEFFTARLPSTLKVVDRGTAYGLEYVVEVVGTGGFFRYPDKVCSIEVDGVVLESPQYYSDIETILKAWEAETGREATLRYWEEA